MMLDESSKQSGWKVALRVFGGVVGLVLALFLTWSAFAMGISDPPPDFLPVTVLSIGAAVCTFIAALTLALGPAVARLSPAMPYVPALLFLLAGVLALATGMFSPVLFGVLAVYAFLLRP